MKYNYSIIIPHHNIPNMLERAIKSVPLRDDVEIIVVDDASDEKYKPKIKEICTIRSAQIKLVLLAENGGGGKARNKGLDIAQGEFVVFLDADDFFNYCINQAMDDYKDVDTDIIFFRAGSIDEQTYLPLHRADRINCCVNDFLNRAPDCDYEIRYEQGCPVSKFIKRSLLEEHNIRFEEIRKHNDVRFSYTSGFYAKNIAADPRAIYCITTRSDSVSMDVSAEARLLRVNVTADFIKFKKEHGLTIDNEDFLFDTMAEIFFKDKSIYNKGLKKIEAIGLPNVFISKRLRIAIRNHKIRIILSPKVRIILKKILKW